MWLPLVTYTNARWKRDRRSGAGPRTGLGLRTFVSTLPGVGRNATAARQSACATSLTLHAAGPRRKYSTVRRSPSSSVTRGSQPSTARAFEMSGRRCLGSSSGSGRNTMRRLLPVSARMCSANSQNGHFARIAQVHRVAFVGEHQPVQAVHQVAHVAEAAGLRAVAENRHRLARAAPGRETPAPRGRRPASCAGRRY